MLYVHVAVERQEDVRWLSEEGGGGGGGEEDEEAGTEVEVEVQEEAVSEIGTGAGTEARTNINIGKILQNVNTVYMGHWQKRLYGYHPYPGTWMKMEMEQEKEIGR